MANVNQLRQLEVRSLTQTDVDVDVTALADWWAKSQLTLALNSEQQKGQSV